MKIACISNEMHQYLIFSLTLSKLSMIGKFLQIFGTYLQTGDVSLAEAAEI